MYFSSLSVHMLCGLFMLTPGRATLRSTFQELTSTFVAVPDLVLPAVFSIWVSIQTSPTPGVPGRWFNAGKVFGVWNLLLRYASRIGTSCGDPFESYIRIGAGGYVGFHVRSSVLLNFCQLAGAVMLKNFCTSSEMMSASDGTFSARLLTLSFLPKSRPGVSGSSTTTAPSMYGWILQTNA